MSSKPREFSDSNPVDALSRLWILRMLVPLGGHKVLVSRSGFSNSALARAVGVGAWLDNDELDFNPSAVHKKLRELHRMAEENAAAARLPDTLVVNMARLGELVGLSPTDARILEFAAMLHQDRLLDDSADTLGLLNSLKVIDTLARLLDLNADDVRASISPHGVLARSGLLAVDRGTNDYLRSKLDVLSGSFVDHIVAFEADPICLLRDTISSSKPASLTLKDYGHLDQALALLRPYLANALSSGLTGVNVFFHGAPGMGKSELARALAAALECELFEVASEDADGDPVNGERRLRAYRAAQSFFCQRKAMILFDEVEDVFDNGDGPFGRKSTAQRRKAWLNRTLEQNKVPTLWLSNSIDGIDAAFMRRFDMVIEVPIPPRAQRERIVRVTCNDLLDDQAIKRLAESEVVAPAVISRAASVVRSIHDQFDATGATRALQYLVDQSLEAQGHSPLRVGDANRLPAGYDASLINANVDLCRLADGLAKTRSGRLCLYGPPGTGKTAYGRWLAQYLGMPLTLYSASELMSKWVGESEKNIAGAFRQAERDNALLLIDEVDSFLQDRAHARQSWEATMVNEMLTQLESFSGVFVASTNLMDGLDPAALRRFDLKIAFDFLLPNQAATLLESYCKALSLTAPELTELEQVRHLRSATPGDFATVARRHRFAPIVSPAELVAAVETECRLKERKSSGIGFVY
ncbi:ATP-binding protein|uniref:AAA family ATPase n=1 Tax=Noviherbaspirillum sp. L7-7A TaxID=2850560 RepID=UPI001C2C2B49|nr:ATP-binding protein [Noviherbaspirillum sp. L7-7A]MBV0880725.1 ATP-binding protein [Noviherbaspirillum sp. L7-7A]